MNTHNDNINSIPANYIYVNYCIYDIVILRVYDDGSMFYDLI